VDGGNYGPETYGDRWADVYDDWYRREGDVEATVERVVAIAGEGARVLELGAGTGRLAIPLAQRGLHVVALDASAAMLDRLRAKPSGDAVETVVGDMADVAVDGSFALALVAFNTFFNLTTQDDQQRCLRNVARALDSGGALLIEAFVPDASRVAPTQAVEARSVGPDEVVIQATRHDASTQRIDMTTIVITEAGIRLLPLQARYAMPAELDDMARCAGFARVARWADWRGAPFTTASPQHVSLYKRVPG
jgi:ubiquinone/menaquinone biosynthesis C-methylase UbiE